MQLRRPLRRLALPAALLVTVPVVWFAVANSADDAADRGGPATSAGAGAGSPQASPGGASAGAYRGASRIAPGLPTAAQVCEPGGEDAADPLPEPELTATRIPGSFTFLEGPVWVADQNRLLVSDLGNPTGPDGVQPSDILSLTLPDSFDVFVDDGGSNGLALSPDGSKLLAATHDQRSVSSYDLDSGQRGAVAEQFEGRSFNSPNDLAVRGDGTIYFTDPDFQRGNRPSEMGGTTGVYRVKDGRVTLVDGDISNPNGVVLSPDEQTLYVGGFGTKIFKYEVNADGSTGPRTEFADITTPDGATVDCAGNLYWASFYGDGIEVFAPDGEHLGTITAGANTTNIAFGGPDGRTLFITSGVNGDFSVYRTDLAIPGLPY